MKTAIYIEDGVVQLVLTPENSFEKSSLSAFKNTPVKTEIMEGSFYQCSGGWMRNAIGSCYHGEDDRSLILRTSRD